MRVTSAHKLVFRAWLAFVLVAFCVGFSTAFAQEAVEDETPRIGGVALGAAYAGLIDRAYVYGPPDQPYVVARAPGSFLDCGAGSAFRRNDELGQSELPLYCGVTLSETVSVPQVGEKARLIVFY